MIGLWCVGDRIFFVLSFNKLNGGSGRLLSGKGNKDLGGRNGGDERGGENTGGFYSVFLRSADFFEYGR